VRALVTGGAGFIGSHLVDALLRRGDEVSVIDDLSSGDRANLPARVDLVEADVANPATIERVALLRPDIVFHLAAQVSVARSMGDPDRDRDINVAGTRHVLAGAAGAGSARVVFVSSGGAIYGEAACASEEASIAPASYYGIHKFTAERYVALGGLPYAIARLANVFGPRQRGDLEGGVVAVFSERLRARQPVTIYGSGDQRRDFIHVNDVIAALLVMGETCRNGLWNVGTGEETTVSELLHELEGVLGAAVEVRHLPARPGDIFASSLSFGRIRTELGWRPRLSLLDGLRATASP
jgi:UDP-glucose 4-epimerase